MQLTEKQKQESIVAIRKYIGQKSGNENRHKAFVKTSEKEEDYPSTLFVYAEVSKKAAKVIVEWNGTCGYDYPTDFLSSSSLFQFRYGALHIDSKDSFGRRISVTITSQN